MIVNKFPQLRRATQKITIEARERVVIKSGEPIMVLDRLAASAHYPRLEPRYVIEIDPGEPTFVLSESILETATVPA